MSYGSWLPCDLLSDTLAVRAQHNRDLDCVHAFKLIVKRTQGEMHLRLQDMAAAVAYLASEDASYVTGETIVVAGGMHSRL